MLTRREFLTATAHLTAVAALPSCALHDANPQGGILVNDMQSQLNATYVERIIKPRSIEMIQAAIRPKSSVIFVLVWWAC